MEKKNKRKIVIILIIVFILIFAVFKIFSNKNENKSVALYENYQYSTVTKTKNLGNIHLNGVITSSSPVGVFVDKNLKVKEVFVKDGDYVKKGEILMSFDDDDINRLNRAFSKESLKLNKLKRDYRLTSELLKIGGASKEDLKNIEDNIKISNLNISEIQEEINKTAKFIKSPLNGVVKNVKAQAHYLVDTKTPLLEIIDLESLKVTVEVPEHQVSFVKVGQKAKVMPDIFNGKRALDGKVSKISKISTVSDKSSENVLKTDIELLEKVDELVPGFIVDADIFAESSEELLLVSKIAIRDEDNKYFIYTIDKDDVVHKKYIEIDPNANENVIVKSGLNDGEVIIENPDEFLKDGLKLQHKK